MRPRGFLATYPGIAVLPAVRYGRIYAEALERACRGDKRALRQLPGAASDYLNSPYRTIVR